MSRTCMNPGDLPRPRTLKEPKFFSLPPRTSPPPLRSCDESVGPLSRRDGHVGGMLSAKAGFLTLRLRHDRHLPCFPHTHARGKPDSCGNSIKLRLFYADS
eukprot:scaffold283315_cov22-Tisochrysis_lutea.AAC.1